MSERVRGMVAGRRYDGRIGAEAVEQRAGVQEFAGEERRGKQGGTEEEEAAEVAEKLLVAAIIG